jgi:hypothetical protein
MRMQRGNAKSTTAIASGASVRFGVMATPSTFLQQSKSTAVPVALACSAGQ